VRMRLGRHPGGLDSGGPAVGPVRARLTPTPGLWGPFWEGSPASGGAGATVHSPLGAAAHSPLGAAVQGLFGVAVHSPLRVG
jgi:hypothetical protein